MGSLANCGNIPFRVLADGSFVQVSSPARMGEPAAAIAALDRVFLASVLGAKRRASGRDSGDDEAIVKELSEDGSGVEALLVLFARVILVGLTEFEGVARGVAFLGLVGGTSEVIESVERPAGAGTFSDRAMEALLTLEESRAAFFGGIVKDCLSISKERR